MSGNTKGEKVFTTPDYEFESLGSLITNIRPNRWRESEGFDIFDELQVENFSAFGAADANFPVEAEDTMVSPELLQRCVTKKSPGAFHTTIATQGKRSASSILVTKECILNFDENQEGMPYDTVYVLNKDVYIHQARKRTEYYKNMYTTDLLEAFSRTASPEILLDLISSTVAYRDNSYELSPVVPEDTKTLLTNFSTLIDFSKCDRCDNLRSIKAIINNMHQLKASNSDLFKEISKKCQERLWTIAKTRNFSMTDAVNQCLEVLHQSKQLSSHDMMLDFIESETKKQKKQEYFLLEKICKKKLKTKIWKDK